MVVGGLGFWGLGLGLLGLVFSVDAVLGLWCRASGFFGVGALFIEEYPWEINYASIPAQFVRHGVYHCVHK